MLGGVGCDLVTISRLEKAVSRPGFLERVFTEGEIEYCESRGVQKFQSLAARFAAKEAVWKALGTGFREGEFTDVEVVQDELGKPELVLHGAIKKLADSQGVVKISLSLSHEGNQAMAMVVTEVER